MIYNQAHTHFVASTLSIPSSGTPSLQAALYQRSGQVYAILLNHVSGAPMPTTSPPSNPSTTQICNTIMTATSHQLCFQPSPLLWLAFIYMRLLPFPSSSWRTLPTEQLAFMPPLHFFSSITLFKTDVLGITLASISSTINGFWWTPLLFSLSPSLSPLTLFHDMAHISRFLPLSQPNSSPPPTPIHVLSFPSPPFLFMYTHKYTPSLPFLPPGPIP